MILFSIVLIEVVFGTYAVFRHLQKIENQRKVLGAQKVTRINSEIITQKPSDNFKYYYELSPNRVLEDVPDWLPYRVKNTINGDGLNDRFDYDLEKPTNTIRIMAIGDSYTYGQNVNTEDSWPEQLEDLLSQEKKCPNTTFEVINLGMSGFDIPYLAKRYENIGAKYNPDLIVWYESSSGFARYLEYARPIIDDCTQKIDLNSTQVAGSDPILECWKLGQSEMYKRYTYVEVSRRISESFNKFMHSVRPSDFYYVASSWIAETEDERMLFRSWQNTYGDAHILNSGPNLVGEGILHDGHPSKVGHKEIARNILLTLKSSREDFDGCFEQ